MLTGASAQAQALGACRVSRKQKEEGTGGAGAAGSLSSEEPKAARGRGRKLSKFWSVLFCFGVGGRLSTKFTKISGGSKLHGI